MNLAHVESIARAVLYEGYMLYPYRHSAVKNKQRWNFGVLYPASYSALQTGTDSSFMQTECLVRGNEDSTHIEVSAHFLQCISRQMGKPLADAAINTDTRTADFEIVESLSVGDTVFQSWQEAAECETLFLRFSLEAVLAEPIRRIFTFPGGQELEPVNDSEGTRAALIVRTRKAITASVDVSATRCTADVFKLTVMLSNLTDEANPEKIDREQVLLKSLLSAHTILGVSGGNFISMMDPPPALREIAAGCSNIGTWPVLAGKEPSTDTLLSSPIILYDYPQIAPESAGDLFDGTEIDEILALRILTLSEEEKQEIRQTDQRSREILDHTESMPAEHFMKLHGAMRSLKPSAGAAANSSPGEDQR